MITQELKMPRRAILCSQHFQEKGVEGVAEPSIVEANIHHAVDVKDRRTRHGS